MTDEAPEAQDEKPEQPEEAPLHVVLDVQSGKHAFTDRR